MLNNKLYCYIVILLFGFFVLFINVDIVNAQTCADLKNTNSYYTCEYPPPAPAPGACEGQGQKCIETPDDCTGGTWCCLCNIHLSGGGQSGIVPDGGKKATGDYTLNDMVSILPIYANRFLGIAGSLALLAFIYGGVMFLISAGNTERVTKARTIIIGAVIGLIIVFASFMIINFIITGLGYSFGTWYIVK
jgi:hypothetical protein